MIGSIIGDICGSVYEYKVFEEEDLILLRDDVKFTDDTILTVAVAESLLAGHSFKELTENVVKYSLNYPKRGYGGRYYEWLKNPIEPYNSFGNGSAMRVSSVGFLYDTEDEVLEKAKFTAEITHNHPEGVKGAQAIALAIFLARNGATKDIIKRTISLKFDYDLDRTLVEIKKEYKFNAICQTTVPEAIISFLEADDFESTIYKAISLGGDTDTLACMAGGIAEAFYGVDSIPEKYIVRALDILPTEFKIVIDNFYDLKR